MIPPNKASDISQKKRASFMPQKTKRLLPPLQNEKRFSRLESDIAGIQGVKKTSDFVGQFLLDEKEEGEIERSRSSQLKKFSNKKISVAALGSPRANVEKNKFLGKKIAPNY